MQARVKAEVFFKEGGKKTEDGLNHVGASMNNLLKGAEDAFKHARPSWWNGGSSGSGGIIPRAPLHGDGHAASGYPEALPRGVAAFGAVNAVVVPPGANAQALDDVAMRRHCAALERLIEIGLSPQAARVALRHLDSWLVCQEGQDEMAIAEAAAQASGEPILHVGDRARLEGLVKATSVNGMVGTLTAYGAADLRWKVQLSDGQIFWVRPKLLKPLEVNRLPLQSASAVGASPSAPSRCSELTPAPAASELIEGWAALDARKARWHEEQQLRDIELLEREEVLRKLQEALEAEQLQIGEQRHSLAIERAHSMSDAGRRNSEPVEFVMGKVGSKIAAIVEEGTHDRSATSLGSDAEDPDDEEDEREADEMWDMDWSKLAADGRAAAAVGSVAASSASSPTAAKSAAPSSQPSSPTPALGVEASAVAGEGARAAGGAAAASAIGAAEAEEAEVEVVAAPAEEAQADRAESFREAGAEEEVEEELELVAEQEEVEVPSPAGLDATPGPSPELSEGTPDSAAASPGLKPGQPRSQGAWSSRSGERRERSLPPPREASEAPLNMPAPERENLHKTLEEKRRLAEVHNGQDLTINKRKEFEKGRMPGVHPAIAQKLEERRRKLELEEAAGDSLPVAA